MPDDLKSKPSKKPNTHGICDWQVKENCSLVIEADSGGSIRSGDHGNNKLLGLAPLYPHPANHSLRVGAQTNTGLVDGRMNT